jgi:hypothetical protein
LFSEFREGNITAFSAAPNEPNAQTGAAEAQK